MIEGDGIGPEVCEAVRTVIAATGAPIEWVIAEAGLGALEHHGDPLPNETLALLREHRVGIKGPTMTPTGEGHRSVNVRLREELGLFAGVRPVRTIAGVHHPLSALKRTVNLVVVRENLEDLYAGIEFTWGELSPSTQTEINVRHAITEGGAIALKVITPERTKQICIFAFRYARQHGRKKVTCVHKANILKETDGLFLRIFQEVAGAYPDIEANDFLMDAAAMRLVRNPEQFDVLVCPNLYGDILSDLCAALVGGLGVVPGANIGADCALFEAVHGTAPDIAGQGKANPTALLLSAVMMLEHLYELDVHAHPIVGDQVGYGSIAKWLRSAIRHVVGGPYVTADIWRKGDDPDDVPASTMRMTQAITEHYRAVVDEEMDTGFGR